MLNDPASMLRPGLIFYRHPQVYIFQKNVFPNMQYTGDFLSLLNDNFEAATFLTLANLLFKTNICGPKVLPRSIARRPHLALDGGLPRRKLNCWSDRHVSLSSFPSEDVLLKLVTRLFALILRIQPEANGSKSIECCLSRVPCSHRTLRL